MKHQKRDNPYPNKYMNPYLAGVLLGLVIIAAFFFSGEGLGGSGAYKDMVKASVVKVAPEYAANAVYFEKAGFEIMSTRPLTKMATPKEFTWNWPKSFFNIYLPKLVDVGYLTSQEVKDALQEFDDLDNEPGATIFCPTMLEVIARKI